MSVLNTYGCERAALIQKYQENNEESVKEEITESNRKMQRDIEQNWGRKLFTKVAIGFEIIKYIDPIFPTPGTCTSEKYSCLDYISEETHVCMNSILAADERKEYNPPTFGLFISNILLLFLEGYIVSIISAFIYSSKNSAIAVFARV